MSTPIVKIISPTEDILSDKYFVVQKERLADVVKRLREEQNLSLDAVRKNSGYKLATSYLNRIENGQVTADVISIGKLLALARGLNESIYTLVDRALGLDRGVIENEERLVALFRGLPQQRRNDLLNIAMTFYSQKPDEAWIETAVTTQNGNIEPVPDANVRHVRHFGELSDETKKQKQKPVRKKAGGRR